jgi:CRP-like cAMP-binding protein
VPRSGWHASGILTAVMNAPAITSCATCPAGRAAGVRYGGRCPLVDRKRPRGATICLEGEPASTIWLVKRGTVVLSRTHADGQERPRAVRAAGSFVGLEALVRPTYADTARTTEASVLCGTTREAFDGWLGPAGTPVRMALELLLATVVAEDPRPAAPDGPATRRVARFLLDAGDGEAPQVPRQVLAALLGMVPETLSRALARLRDAGTIELTRRRVSITDRSRLEALSLPVRLSACDDETLPTAPRRSRLRTPTAGG